MAVNNETMQDRETSEIFHSNFLDLYLNGTDGETGSINVAFNSTLRKSLTPEAVHQMVLLGAFMVVALTGNSIVLIHLIRVKGWMRPVSIFVMSLATTDILIAMLSMSTELLWEAFGEWIFGNFACKFSTYVQCLLFISTSSILMSMSWDRYEAICKPLSAFSRSLARCRRTIFLSWSLAAVLALPQLFIFVQVQDSEHADGKPKYSCRSAGYTAEWQRKVYVTWIAMLVFIIPLLFVAFCYIRIAAVVWRVTGSFTATNECTQNGTSEVPILRRNMSGRSKCGHIERSKMKAIQLTICILACHILCWTPYFTINLLNVWTDYKFKHNIPSFLKSLAKCLAWFSSCVNPIIYGGFHTSFRPLTRWLFPSCHRKESSPEIDSKKTSVHASPRSFHYNNGESRHGSVAPYLRPPSIPMSALASNVNGKSFSKLERGSSIEAERTYQTLSLKETPTAIAKNASAVWL
ncbi:hypothetical protein RvY_01567 [Ramazzottius varieornatus]|uniref:G-protein coupled receptors family 1 profile domain-containing protein n=1 Tax=Ramazzottius varieornatus TaxID=947166 RepID=A0A1D1UHM3_RAMVA|nr:hypothetical protein RvY_01567 [Ramazzottius varieornatus]